MSEEDIINGRKNTNIGTIPAEWDVVPIGKLANINYGKAKPKSEGNIPVVGSGGVYSWAGESLVNFPTIIVGRKGNAGQAWLFEEPCWPADTTFYLDWKQDVNVRFLYGYMSLNPLSGDHAKTTLPSLQRPDLENYLVPFPPIDEQRRISAVLTIIQQAIAAQEQVIQAAREVKRSLMHRLFTYGPYAEPQPTKETEVGEILEHWEVIEIDKVTQDSAFGPRFSGKLYNHSGNVATLRTTDIDESGTINYASMPRALIKDKKFQKHYLQQSDFLVTRSGTCGIASVFESHPIPVLPGAFLIRLRLHRDLIDPFFLREYFNSPIGRPRIAQIAQGAVQKNISGTRLKQFTVPKPRMWEQVEIRKMIDKVSQKIRIEEARKNALEALFKSMLHQLMTGQIRVAGS